MGDRAIQLMHEALWLVLLLSAPPVLAAALVGLTVAVLQSATQLQEQALQYTAKFIAIIFTLFLTATFLGGELYGFGNRIFTEFPALLKR